MRVRKEDEGGIYIVLDALRLGLGVVLPPWRSGTPSLEGLAPITTTTNTRR